MGLPELKSLSAPVGDILLHEKLQSEVRFPFPQHAIHLLHLQVHVSV
jgi:hypothetical protein